MAHVLRSVGLVSTGLIAVLLTGAVVARAAGAEGDGGGAATAAPLAPGEEVFRDSCSICHNAESGAPTIIAPNLFGIVGRGSATEPGFFYSPAMKTANLTWNEVTLTAFLTAPQQVVPGTTMGFLGFLDPADTANVIAYLNTLK